MGTQRTSHLPRAQLPADLNQPSDGRRLRWDGARRAVNLSQERSPQTAGCRNRDVRVQASRLMSAIATFGPPTAATPAPTTTVTTGQETTKALSPGEGLRRNAFLRVAGGGFEPPTSGL